MELNLPRTPCARCRRPIVWVLSENDKRLPVDPEPTSAGNVWVAYESGVLRGRVSGVGPNGGHRFMPHFATCPVQNGHDRRQGPARKPQPKPANQTALF